jgi:hypothetical protein
MTLVTWHMATKGVAVAGMDWSEEQGWRVLVSDAAKLEAAEKVAEELRGMGMRLVVVYCD